MEITYNPDYIKILNFTKKSVFDYRYIVIYEDNSQSIITFNDYFSILTNPKINIPIKTIRQIDIEFINWYRDLFKYKTKLYITKDIDLIDFYTIRKNKPAEYIETITINYPNIIDFDFDILDLLDKYTSLDKSIVKYDFNINEFDYLDDFIKYDLNILKCNNTSILIDDLNFKLLKELNNKVNVKLEEIIEFDYWYLIIGDNVRVMFSKLLPYYDK